jgi:ABC-type uncharacterized transport system involved in gliding motility auxiliary subunit
MKNLRTILGAASLAFIIISLNALVWSENPFTFWVYAPFGAGLLCGVLWFVMRVVASVRGAEGASLYGLNAVISSIVFLAICSTLYAFARRSEASWDLTREGRRQLSPQTVQVLQRLDRDVDIMCFFVKAGDNRTKLPQDKTRRFLELCQRETTRLKVEYFDAQLDPEKLIELNRSGLFRTGGEIQSVTGVGTVVLRTGTRQREIPLSDVTQRLEERDFTNALLNVTLNANPKVYFLTGHGERKVTVAGPDGIQKLATWLNNESYQVENHIIMRDSPVIPDDCSVLVINRYSELHPHDTYALDAYVKRGGRLLVMVDPQMLDPALQEANVHENMRPWLKSRFGVVVGMDLVISQASGVSMLTMLIPDFNQVEKLTKDYVMERDPYGDFRGSFNGRHPITRGMDSSLVLDRVRSVTLDNPMPVGTGGMVLLRTTPDTWAETDFAALKQGQVNPDPEDMAGPVSIAVAATFRTDEPTPDKSGVKEARIVVMGDTDLSANEVDTQGAYGIKLAANSNLLLNMFAWLSEREDLIAIRATAEEDPPIFLTSSQERTIAWVASLGVVQLVALAGAAMYIMRRKYR